MMSKPTLDSQGSIHVSFPSLFHSNHFSKLSVPVLLIALSQDVFIAPSIPMKELDSPMYLSRLAFLSTTIPKSSGFSPHSTATHLFSGSGCSDFFAKYRHGLSPKSNSVPRYLFDHIEALYA